MMMPAYALIDGDQRLRGALACPVPDDVTLELPEQAGQTITIRPRAPQLATNAGAFLAWYAAQRDRLARIAALAGPVRLTGFAITGTPDFNALASLYDAPREGYVGGATPRSQLAERVFEATASPPVTRLTVHQEMAYLPRWPRKVMFYCAVPSTTGGETITADVRSFDRLVPPRLKDEVRERGVRYLRNFRGPGPIPDALTSIHRTWQQAFYTEAPAEAEAACERMGLVWQWLDDGSLSTQFAAPGFATHPETGETVWFNHVHSQTFVKETVGSIWPIYDEWYSDGKPMGYDVRFGDGGEIPLDERRALFPLLDAVTTGFRWKRGDVLLIDNIMTFHGRNPYTGQRNVQVALLEEGLQ